MKMDGLDDGLTTSLLKEVFDAVDSQTEILNASNSQPPKHATNFLLEEYNRDMDAALGKNKNVPTERKSPAALPRSAVGRECSSATEDKYNELADDDDDDDDDPFRDGENKHWITSKNNFTSQKSCNYFSDGTPKNEKKWPELKNVHGMLNKTIHDVGMVKESPKDALVDPVFHMHITNPKVSTTILREKMIGRESVSPLKIKRFVETNDLKNLNWVTGGAIVGKFITKSQKGNQYCVWTLSDLKGDIKMVSVLLFGSAFKEYWKLSLGVVVGILNPSVLQNKNNKTEATLRVDNSDRIMVFGISKDYGTCRSKKNNGENCTAVVNKASCEYCIYHVKKVYDKASRRPELQAGFTGSGLTNLKNKVLGKNEVFYGGKLYTAFKGRQSLEQNSKEKEKIRTLSIVSSNASKVKKDQELLQRLSGDKAKNKPEPTSSNVERNSASLNQSNESVKETNHVNQKTEKMIDLDIPITNKQLLRAKANALKYIREKGPLKKPTDNIHKKKTPEQIRSLKRKLEKEEVDGKRRKTSEDDQNTPKSLVKQKMERSGITEKFLELMNSQPENPDLLKEAESEEREKYFKKLEIKEKMEDKMASTYKVECKVVKCMNCNYKSFSAADLCKKEKHSLKLVNAVKRFWKCGGCAARTFCFDLVPLYSCRVCGCSKWERASMLPDKKTQVLPDRTLSIRGHEEKFVGSTVRNPNINLLVPDQ